MRPGKDEFGLRLAAKSTDQEKAARLEWPGLEQRLRELGLSFDVTETRGCPSAANRVAVTSVERDDIGIRVNYAIAPPLGAGSHGPRGEAKDDLGNDYDDLGGGFGLARSGWRGVLTLPLPPPAATTLRIRITWGAPLSSIREGPAHEIPVSLPD